MTGMRPGYGGKQGRGYYVCHGFFPLPDAEADTLRDLSFHIRAGEKLALVGLNGAGKTTCVKLMCGLYHPTGGRILINGKDMSKLSRDEYYRLFSVVFQEANFMPFTIAQNVSGSHGGYGQGAG